MEWQTFLDNEKKQDYFTTLMKFLDQEYASKHIYPPKEELFSCFSLCSYDNVKVVILGQDPYHQPNQAHGLSFSVHKGIKIPPSLRNIYKELKDDLDIDSPSHGYLVDWAKQGVFMMNAVMSVEEGKAGSHRKKGWETFCEHVMQELNHHPSPIVFVLWGNWAKEKGMLITNPHHHIITSAHPSPLSAYQGFFGSKPFSKINAFLTQDKLEPIHWKLED